MPVPTFTVAGVLRGGWDSQSHLGVHVWLDRLVTPGPGLELPDPDYYAVGWPPHEAELTVLQR